MGLFDYVLIEQPMDGIADPSAVEWQTKSFDAPFMQKYRITADGRLLREEVHYEDRSDPTAAPGTFASLLGCMTSVHEGWEELPYHGDVRFCGDVHGEFLDYVARFTEGKLVTISRVAPGEKNG